MSQASPATLLSLPQPALVVASFPRRPALPTAALLAASYCRTAAFLPLPLLRIVRALPHHLQPTVVASRASTLFCRGLPPYRQIAVAALPHWCSTGDSAAAAKVKQGESKQVEAQEGEGSKGKGRGRERREEFRVS